MPIRWTPDKDQLLLIKILETHDVSLDAKKIVAAWPEDQGEAPTARAITERLVKIRQLAKSNGASHFNISSAQSRGGSASGTPRSAKKGVSTPRKRQQTRALDEDDDEEEAGDPDMSPSPSKRLRIRKSLPSRYVKPDPEDEDDEVQMVSTAPVLRHPPTFAGGLSAPGLSGQDSDVKIKSSVEEEDADAPVSSRAATAFAESRQQSQRPSHSYAPSYSEDEDDAV